MINIYLSNYKLNEKRLVNSINNMPYKLKTKYIKLY